MTENMWKELPCEVWYWIDLESSEGYDGWLHLRYKGAEGRCMLDLYSLITGDPDAFQTCIDDRAHDFKRAIECL